MMTKLLLKFLHKKTLHFCRKVLFSVKLFFLEEFVDISSFCLGGGGLFREKKCVGSVSGKKRTGSGKIGPDPVKEDPYPVQMYRVWILATFLTFFTGKFYPRSVPEPMFAKKLKM